ncbi:hypothetical protein ABT353_42060 [Nonomuraea wenchangensis]
MSLAARVVGTKRVTKALRQVLGQVLDELVGIGSAGEHALNVHLVAEAQHVKRFGDLVGVELVEGLIPSRQNLARLGGKAAALHAVAAAQRPPAVRACSLEADPGRRRLGLLNYRLLPRSSLTTASRTSTTA